MIDPSSNKLLGVIRLGDPVPSALSPLYKGQLLVHGQAIGPLETLAGGFSAAAGSHSQRFLIVTDLKDPSQVVLRQVGTSSKRGRN